MPLKHWAIWLSSPQEQLLLKESSYVSEKKKFKYIVDSETEKTEITKNESQDSTMLMAYEKVTSETFQKDFIANLCNGIGTTVMDVVVTDKVTGEEKYKFPMRILSIQEEEQLLSDAAEEFQKIKEYARSPERWSLIYARLKVRRSLFKDHLATAPACGEETIKRMTKGMILSLYNKYETCSEILSPCLDKMSEKEVSDLIADVKKNYRELVPQLPRQCVNEILISFFEITDPSLMGNSSIG